MTARDIGRLLREEAEPGVKLSRGQVTAVDAGPPATVTVGGFVMRYIDNGWTPAIGDLTWIFADGTQRVAYGDGTTCLVESLGSITPGLVYLTVDADGSSLYGVTLGNGDPGTYEWDMDTLGTGTKVQSRPASHQNFAQCVVDKDTGDLWAAWRDGSFTDLGTQFYKNNTLLTTHAKVDIGETGGFFWTPGGLFYAGSGDKGNAPNTAQNINIFSVNTSTGALTSVHSEAPGADAAARNFFYECHGTLSGGAWLQAQTIDGGPSVTEWYYWDGSTTITRTGVHHGFSSTSTSAADVVRWRDFSFNTWKMGTDTFTAEDDDCNPFDQLSAAGVGEYSDSNSDWSTSWCAIQNGSASDVYRIIAP